MPHDLNIISSLFTQDQLVEKIEEIIKENKLNYCEARPAFDRGILVGLEAMASLLKDHIPAPTTINTPLLLEHKPDPTEE